MRQKIPSLRWRHYSAAPILALVPGLVLAIVAPDQAPAQTLSDIALKLPRDLSPWGMFMAADIVVKAVMIGLVFASVLSWTIWFAKAIELMVARRHMRRTIAELAKRAHGPTPRACKTTAAAPAR